MIKTVRDRALMWVLALMVGMASAVSAQQPQTFSQEELDRLLAPIALYPDSLLAQVLMASTYPLEVVQAARWSKQNASLKGDALTSALDGQPWDPSVKAVAAFPQVIQMMNEKLDWTQQLGDAVLAQQAEVMETVQNLRKKAQAQGNLKTTKEQKVVVQPESQVIVIEPASPEVVYVPTYNPTVVDGSWWWPSPPYYYYPPGYAAGSALAAGLAFGAGVAIAGSFWNWGNFNWGRGDIDIDVNRNVNIDRTNIRNTNVNAGKWEHNSAHRQGVNYRDTATRDKYGKGQLAGAENRKDFRGFDQGAGGARDRAGERPATRDQQREQARQSLGDRGQGLERPAQKPDRGTGGAGDRAGERPQAGTRDQQRPGAGDRAQASDRAAQKPSREAAPQRGSGGAERATAQARPQPTAFDGMGSGSQTRQQSDRGRASRETRAAPSGGGERSFGGGGGGGGARASAGGGGGARASAGGGGARGGGGGGRGGGGRGR